MSLLAVGQIDGPKTYFHAGMCGVFESPLKLAQTCSKRSGEPVLIRHQGVWLKFFKEN